MRINQSAFQKLKRPTVRVFFKFLFLFLKPARIYEGCLLRRQRVSLYMTPMRREAGGVFNKKKEEIKEKRPRGTRSVTCPDWSRAR